MSFNNTRREIPGEKFDDYLNNSKNTIIQLSDNHYISVKGYNASRSNVLLNNFKSKTNSIKIRQRLLEKLQQKKIDA